MNVDFKYHLGIDFTFKSEPSRYFIFFKPKDIIVDENFRVILHLKNYSEVEFPGGRIALRVEHSETPDMRKPWISKVGYGVLNIPRIPPNETRKIPCPFTFRSPHVGTNYLSPRLLTSKDEGKIILTPLHITEPQRGRIVGVIDDLRECRVPFNVVSKQEISEFYGVWFAIGLSLISIAVSVILYLLSCARS